MILYLVRHCKASGQAPDAPLTEEGRLQAEELADRLQGAGIGTIWSSSFLRALETAQPLARRLGLRVRTDERLKERVLSGGGLPDWRSALARTFSEPDLAYPGGESSRAATERALLALKHISEAEESPGVVVTHGNLLALILRSIDASFGFAEWEALRNPDCFIVTGLEAGSDIRRAF